VPATTDEDHRVIAVRSLSELPAVTGKVERGPDVSALFSAVQKMGGRLELNETLEGVARAVFELLHRATHVSILLSEGKDEERFVPMLARAREGSESGDPGVDTVLMSRSVLRRVLKERTAILAANALDELGGSESIMGAQIRSTIGVPLWRGEKILGVIECDNRASSGIFTEKDLDLLHRKVVGHRSRSFLGQFEIVLFRTGGVGVSFEKNIRVLVLVEYHGQIGQVCLACRFQTRFVHVEHQTGIKRNLDPFTDSLDFCAFEILLHFLGLLVHIVTDVGAGGATDRRTQNRADRGVARLVAHRGARGRPRSSPNDRTLGFVAPRTAHVRQDDDGEQTADEKSFHGRGLLFPKSRGRYLPARGRTRVKPRPSSQSRRFLCRVTTETASKQYRFPFSIRWRGGRMHRDVRLVAITH